MAVDAVGKPEPGGNADPYCWMRSHQNASELELEEAQLPGPGPKPRW